MRKMAGWALTVLGLLAALFGLALAVWLGPDNRRTTGPHALETSDSVVVTAPRVIGWADVQLDVLAEVPAKKPIFVGVGNTVDVENLVANVQRQEITKFSTPWDPTITAREGELPTVQGAPTSLDWWVADSAGLGGAAISTTLPQEPVSLAIVSIGSSNLTGLEISLGYGLKGGFLKGIGVALLGAGAVLGGRILRRGEGLLEEDQLGDDVAYVYVDEHGVEHELTEEELAGGDFDVVDEHELADDEVVYVYVDDDGVEHEVTAADLAAGDYEVDESEPEQEPEPESEPEPEPEPEPRPEPKPEPEPEPEAEREPVYVWIDDDGVEHELTEAELAELGDYEIVNDEQDDR